MSICVYKDESGLFNLLNENKDSSHGKRQSLSLRERKR